MALEDLRHQIFNFHQIPVRGKGERYWHMFKLINGTGTSTHIKSKDYNMTKQNKTI